MKHRWLSILVFMLLVSSTGAVMALGDRTSVAAAPVLPPLTVRVGIPDEGNSPSIDPVNTTIPLITNQLFSGLIRIDPNTPNAPMPDLASAWETTDGSEMVWTFTLRSGLKWSNGAALTASDVRYGILRSLKNKDYGYPLYIIQNGKEYYDGTKSASQVGITVLSATRIRFTLTQSAAYFPAIMALSIARPMPASAIQAWGSTWTTPSHIVTSGPYRLTEWVHHDYFLLDKSNSFYDAANIGIPHIYARQLDAASRLSEFEAGMLDTIGLDSTQVPAVQADSGLSPLLHVAPGGCNYYYGFNTSIAPFDELLVRQAFIAAIDRQGLIDTELGGVPEVARTFTARGIFGYVDGVVDDAGIPYDPTQAAAWLDEAGYTDRSTLPPITLHYNTNPGHQAIAEYVQQSWIDHLGVTVSLEGTDWSTYLNQVSAGSYQVWRMGWCPDYSDAYNYLYDAIVPGTGARFGSWSNATYLSDLAEATQTTDISERLGHYRDAEEILTETDAVLAPLYHFRNYVLTQSYLSRPYAIETHIRDWTILTVTETLYSAAAEDGWILESQESSNAGGTMDAAGTTVFVGDNSKDRQYRGILSFDTSSLPEDASIAAVKLRVMKAGTVGTNPFTTHGKLFADAILGPFSSNSALELADFRFAADKSAAITIGKTPAGGWYSGSMAAANLAYVNTTGLTQFRLRFARDDNDDMGGDYLKFYSGESTDPPELIITYYAP